MDVNTILSVKFKEFQNFLLIISAATSLSKHCCNLSLLVSLWIAFMWCITLVKVVPMKPGQDLPPNSLQMFEFKKSVTKMCHRVFCRLSRVTRTFSLERNAAVGFSECYFFDAISSKNNSIHWFYLVGDSKRQILKTWWLQTKTIC